MAKKARSKNVTGTSEAGEAVDISTTDHTFLNSIEGLYVGTGGDVIVRLKGDDADQTFKNVADGTVLPIAPSIVRRTSTTAADMIGLL